MNSTRTGTRSTSSPSTRTSGNPQAHSERRMKMPRTREHKQLTRAGHHSTHNSAPQPSAGTRKPQGERATNSGNPPQSVVIGGTHHALPHHLALIVVNLHQLAQHPIHIRDINDTPLSVAHTQAHIRARIRIIAIRTLQSEKNKNQPAPRAHQHVSINKNREQCAHLIAHN